MPIAKLLMLMSEDKIILPGFIIADLYKSSLVDINHFSTELQTSQGEPLSTENDIADASAEKIKYDGENLKNITVVINLPRAGHLNKEDLSFLSNILKACQLSIADIAIVNASDKNVNYAAIEEQLSARQIILFDVEPDVIQLPFRIPPFQLQKYADCTILFAPALSALNKQTQEGKLLKTKLWNSLKQLFGI